MVLVDGGATHKFIDAALVERRKLQSKNFDGFIVIIPDNNSMDYNKWIPKLQVTLGNHTITDNFYVVNLADTNVVLGVQWFYSYGIISEISSHSNKVEKIKRETHLIEGNAHLPKSSGVLSQHEVYLEAWRHIMDY